MQITTPPDAVRVLAPQLFSEVDDAAQLFAGELREFLPDNVFDAHAHLYDMSHLTRANKWPEEYSDRRVEFEFFRERQRAWMNERAPQGGLFFAFPARDLDLEAANDFVRDTIQNQPLSRGLLMITPCDEPGAVEERVLREGWAGFKVYHLFAPRPDTQNAATEEFLPEWAWEIANRHRLAIMLHLVRARSLADEANQNTINTMCRKYPEARLILAHAARGFCARHTVDGIAAVAGVENLFFDTSAICEASALEAILEKFGPSRLLYGSDFPISEARGRAVTLGDGFHWIYEWQHSDWPLGRPCLVGIESLLAIKRAAETTRLDGSDLELIFGQNARRLLGIAPQSTPLDEQQLYRLAKELIPGGVQLLSKRPEMYAPEVWPPYFREARGIEIITLEGRRVLDFTTGGIGSCLLGYAHPAVNAAVERRVRLGAMSTLNPPEEVELAQRLLALHPWAQNVRFGRTGGEMLAAAVRIARAATQRDTVAFCGYHGWHDWYLAANLQDEAALAGHLLPGLEPNGVPSTLRGTALPFHYNDVASLERIVRANKSTLAAIVMEPLRSCEPESGFLEAMRSICDESGARLIFDEVTAGFRFTKGGAHLQWKVAPDLAVFGKALGNGHPMAAILGTRDTMQTAQETFISSTYWTESVGPAAALATLEVLADEDVPAHIHKIGEQLRAGMRRLAAEFDIPLIVEGLAPLTQLRFEGQHALAMMTLFTARMLERGFLAGAVFYPTLAHQSDVVDNYLAAARSVLQELGEVANSDDVVLRLSTPVRHSGFARLN